MSLSHDRATVEDIERACTNSDASAVEALLSCANVEEAFVLQTCNRAEAYVVTDDAASGRRVLARFVEHVPTDVIRELGHEESIRHLMRIAAGLDPVLHDEGLGQVRDAYETARIVGGVGPLLEDSLPKALRVGERARSATAERVEAMIDMAIDDLMTQYKRKRADEVMAAMYEGAERTKNRELETAFSRLESAGTLTDDQRTVVEAMADAIVNQLMAAPIRSLREAAENDEWSTINTALELFDPTDVGVFADSTPAAIPEEVGEEMPEGVLEALAAEEE